MAAFWDDLGARRDVVRVTLTDFGRNVVERDALEDGLDLPVTTDFRAVLASLTSAQLGIENHSVVFPAWNGERLPLHHGRWAAAGRACFLEPLQESGACGGWSPSRPLRGHVHYTSAGQGGAALTPLTRVNRY